MKIEFVGKQNIKIIEKFILEEYNIKNKIKK